MPARTPRVSVVIPSFTDDRATNLSRLRVALAGQSLTDHEVIVVPGISPQGRAINRGVADARGSHLVILDDDSSIRDPRLLEKLVAVLDADPSIGMAGASVRTPPDAGWFQRRAAKEMPRFNVPIVDRVVESDLACHGCVAFPTAAFHAIGGEREEIVRGLDPDLRMRFRQHGYRVVLVPDAVVYHPLPSTLAKFMRTFVRNGAGSADAQARHPELVYETDETLDSSKFVPRRSFAYRVLRFPLRLIWAVLTARPLRALAYTCYAVGFVTSYARLRLARPEPSP